MGTRLLVTALLPPLILLAAPPLHAATAVITDAGTEQHRATVRCGGEDIVIKISTGVWGEQHLQDFWGEIVFLNLGRPGLVLSRSAKHKLDGTS